jgi:zinc D-Ala-D-Ala dipeptidase
MFPLALSEPIRATSPWLIIVLLFMAHTQRFKHALDGHQQLIVVTSVDSATVMGALRTYSRQANGTWQLDFGPQEVSLGRSGLAWGVGMHHSSLSVGYKKQEGDGKSPAGMYRIGSAFGYATELPTCRLPYHNVSEVTQCIEDVNSKYYNRILDSTDIADADWTSTDHMLRDDDLYKWGFFVEHNTPAEASKGSCIFFHLWRGPNKPTAGCTAMAEDHMVRLLEWINPASQPVLVQLTETQYRYWKYLYDLPELE